MEPDEMPERSIPPWRVTTPIGDPSGPTSAVYVIGSTADLPESASLKAAIGDPRAPLFTPLLASASSLRAAT